MRLIQSPKTRDANPRTLFATAQLYLKFGQDLAEKRARAEEKIAATRGGKARRLSATHKWR
jgi:hypothetical protein